ncbi:MAG: aminotransferase class I/II-fold pyridoxal phosphate-dependent enzyme [Acidimicrobiia bacterium]|nr:aminotransferase class I/II-fold pyridoxal phosphate-dependent enzyme [Acidimicrobiia bacterium]
MHVNPILRAMGGYPLAEIQMRARALREAGRPLVDFSIGDPREPTPEFIREALRNSVPPISQYPTTRGLAELRDAISAYLGRRFGVEVDPVTQIIPTTGSKEGIFHTPFAFIEPGAGHSVVYGTPGYPVYERGARFAGAVLDPIRLEGDFVLRAADVGDEVWDRARLVWSCSPHNPTGAVTSTAELADLLERARAAGAWFLSDECYVDVYEEDPPGSVLQVAGPDLAGTLAYYSCSKRSGMTGYRSGAIIGDADAIAALGDLRASAGVAPPEFVQAAAVAAWSDDDHAAERRAIFAAKRAALLPAFETLGLDVIASRAALYMWVKVEDDVAATMRLLDRGVVVSSGRSFGAGGEGYIRLALVPTLEECEQAVEVLVDCLGT